MPGLIDRLYRNLVIRGYEDGLHGRAIHTYWAELERTQWLGRVELEALQVVALQRLLAHAQQHCPYFRKAWSLLGLDAARVQSLEELRRWPLLDRETIRSHRLEMRARVPGLRLISKATGGSSGVPLQFDLDVGSLERRMAATYRGYAWAKAGPGTRQFYLWGTALGDRAWWQRLKDTLYDRLYRREVVSAFELSEAAAPDVVGRLNRYRPQVIVAYTNALYELARMLDERHLVPYAPKSIVVGAERLHDFQRALIERVFRAPVFETYGSREFMLIGAECELHQGLHLTSEQLLLEIVDEDGRPTANGEEGNVVITDLYNYGMPFVRYLNGDRAVAGFGNCACGRGLPTLRKVAGRQLDLLTTPDGRRLPARAVPPPPQGFCLRTPVPGRAGVAFARHAQGGAVDGQARPRLEQIERQASAVLGPPGPVLHRAGRRHSTDRRGEATGRGQPAGRRSRPAHPILSSRDLHLLFFSNAFPTPVEHIKGVFNQILVEDLRRAGHSVDVCSPVPWTANWPFRPRASAGAWRDTRVSYPAFYFPPRLLHHLYHHFLWASVRRTLRRLLWKRRPDAIVAYWAHPDGAVALRAAREVGVPTLLIVGGSDILLLTAEPSRRAAILDVLHGVDAVLAVGGHLSDRLLEMGVEAGKVHVLRRRVDTTFFHPGPGTRPADALVYPLSTRWSFGWGEWSR